MPATVVLCLLAGCSAVAEDDVRLRRYELPDSGALELTLPPGWQDTVDVQPGSAELTIELRAGPQAAFEAFVTPEARERAPGRVQDADTLRESIRDAAARVAETSGAELPDLRRLQGMDGIGYYFVAADPAPPPGELAILVQGALITGRLILRFELLAQDPDDPAIAEALAMLQGAAHLDRSPDGP